YGAPRRWPGRPRRSRTTEPKPAMPAWLSLLILILLEPNVGELNRSATYLFEQAVVEETLRISILGFRVIEELKQVGVAFLVHLKRITEVFPVVFKGSLQHCLVVNSGVLAQHLLA